MNYKRKIFYKITLAKCSFSDDKLSYYKHVLIKFPVFFQNPHFDF